jgi:hypothetical protein
MKKLLDLYDILVIRKAQVAMISIVIMLCFITIFEIFTKNTYGFIDFVLHLARFITIVCIGGVAYFGWSYPRARYVIHADNTFYRDGILAACKEKGIKIYHQSSGIGFDHKRDMLYITMAVTPR